MRKGWLILLLMAWAVTAWAQTGAAVPQPSAVTAPSSADQSRRYDMFFLEAVSQRAKGNAAAAFDLLRHCVAIDSTKAEAYFYLAQYYSALRLKEQALACSKRAADLAPANSTYLETLAESYVNNRQYAEAIDVLERLYDRNRTREDVVGMLVELYEQQHDYANAIRYIEKLETLGGKNERLSYAKSNFYTQLGDKKAAIAEMKQLADQYPADLNYRGYYANILLVNDQAKKAVAIYNDILKQEPDNHNALMAMLAYYQDEGDTVKADAMTERILLNRNTTTEVRAYLMRQEIGRSEQLRGGDSTRVLRLFRQMLDQPEPDVEIALVGASYMNLKKMPQDSIIPVLERVLDVQPDNAAARLQLVNYAWQADSMSHVVDLCATARQYNPDNMAFYYFQGIAYLRQGKNDDALSAFQNGVSVITDDSNPELVSDFYAAMGDLLHQKGLDAEAFAAYDSCLQHKPDNIGCLNNYAYYLSLKGQQLERAEQMSYKTVKAEPKNATFLDTYAWILFRLERYAEAKIYIDQTLQCDSDSSAVMLEHAGDIYFKCGDTARALELWRQALDRATPNSEAGTEDRKAVLTRKIKLKKYIEE